MEDKKYEHVASKKFSLLEAFKKIKSLLDDSQPTKKKKKKKYMGSSRAGNIHQTKHIRKLEEMGH